MAIKVQVENNERSLYGEGDDTMRHKAHRGTISTTPQAPNKAEGSIADRIVKIGHALTVSELAEILNVSRAFLYRLAASGKVPSLRVGAAVRFDPISVAAWLQKDIHTQYR